MLQSLASAFVCSMVLAHVAWQITRGPPVLLDPELLRDLRKVVPPSAAEDRTIPATTAAPPTRAAPRSADPTNKALSPPSAMNDQEVYAQINQMVQFIHQEAKEKAAEIKLKTDEEFNIEKLRMVEAEKQKIRAEYERKEKQVEVQKRM